MPALDRSMNPSMNRSDLSEKVHGIILCWDCVYTCRFGIGSTCSPRRTECMYLRLRHPEPLPDDFRLLGRQLTRIQPTTEFSCRLPFARFS